MADAAAQKREARRRRILQNSEDRLKKITGLYSNDQESEESSISPKISPKFESLLHNADTEQVNGVDTPHVQNEDAPPLKMVEPIVEQSILDDLEGSGLYQSDLPPGDSLWDQPSNDTSDPLLSSSSTKTAVAQSPLIYFISIVRLHIIALAVIVRVLLLLNCGSLFGESAVVPLCTMEVAELLISKSRGGEPKEKSSGYLGIALMLSGMTPQKVSNLLHVVCTINQFSQDFCLYFFTFALTHVVLKSIF